MSKYNIRTHERAYCILCGRGGAILYSGLSDRLFDAPGIWDVMSCNDCNFIWLKNFPIDEDISMVYPPSRGLGQFTSSNSVNIEISFKEQIKSAIRLYILGAIYGYRHLVKSSLHNLLGHLFSQVPLLKRKAIYYANFVQGVQDGKVLDVGCGYGDLLVRFHALGWKCYGVEPDIQAFFSLKRAPNLIVYNSTLEGSKLPNDFFDAIICNHVIEHLPNPTQTLGEMYRILKPGGKLVITTPNIQGGCHKKFKQYWYHLDLPRHLLMFSPKSLRKISVVNKFRVINLFTINRQVDMTYFASLMIKKNGNLGDFFKSAENISLVSRITAILNRFVNFDKFTGEEIVIVLSK